MRELFLYLRREDCADHADKVATYSDGDLHDAWARLTEPDGARRIAAAAGFTPTDDERATMLARLRATLPLERAFFVAMSSDERRAWVRSASFDDERALRIKLGPHAELLENAVAAERAAAEANARAMSDRAYREAMSAWRATKT